MWKMVLIGLFACVGVFALGAVPDVYLSAAPCGDEVLLVDLRRIADDRVLDTQKVLSRYKTPEYEMWDVTGDGVGELLVYTRGGGTGCVMDQLSIFAVTGERLVEAARFNLTGSYNSNPGCCPLVLPDGKRVDLPIKEGKVGGVVEFLPDGELLYSYAQAVRDCEDLTLDFRIERYRFNPVTGKFEPQIRR